MYAAKKKRPLDDWQGILKTRLAQMGESEENAAKMVGLLEEMVGEPENRP